MFGLFDQHMKLIDATVKALFDVLYKKYKM